ncbi:MAG TPA: NAD(P)H-binding protein [Longimicrobiaceae bacterium]|nr:NAD(P)H-binding protein [Longimicrobiaceae bacterium]
MRALLLGATGLVGRHCLDLLLADDAFPSVAVLGRRRVERASPKLEQRVVDFDRLDEHADAFAAEAVFCCLGTTLRAAGSREAFRRVDHDYPVRAAQLAAAGGARQFLLVTALGADPGSSVFYNRVKGETEAAVRALPLPGVAILRPSLLLGEREGRRPAEALAQKAAPLLNPLLVGPLRKYRALPGAAVARALVRLAREGVEGVRIVESDEIAVLAGAA